MCRSSNHIFKRFSSGSQLALTDRVLAGSLAPHTATGCKSEKGQCDKLPILSFIYS